MERGTRARPVEVESAAVIEGHAQLWMTCPHCNGEYRILDHTRPVPGLRELEVECRFCGVPRSLWFRIVEPN